MSAFTSDDIQHVIISPESISTWSISEGSLKNLVADLANTTVEVNAVTQWIFTRPENVSVATVSTNSTSLRLSESLQMELLAALNVSNQLNVTIPSLYPMFVHLTVGSTPANDLPPAFFGLAANVSLQHLPQATTSWWNIFQVNQTQV